MSAWIVSKRHIDALVTGLINAGLIRRAHANSTGVMLWAENHHSINARYSHRGTEVAPDYTYAPHEVTTAVLLKAIRCYDYQTCEHLGWEESRAKSLMDRLEATIDPESPQVKLYYDEAPWGL